jgi:uncharacterized protein YndB with AHSA1/START domain
MELHNDPTLAEEYLAVRRELVLPFTREEAWPLLGDPAELETWFADEGGFEIEEGASGPVRVDDGERFAVVEEVVEGRRISFRWWDPAEPAAETLVEMTLDDVADGTRLVVVELPVQSLPAAPAGPGGGPQLAAAR